MLEKIKRISVKAKIAVVAIVVILAGVIISLATGTSTPLKSLKTENIKAMAAQWPDCFALDEYTEPEFKDDKARDNNAFNVADFGEQGNNGWFYRYGKATQPAKSKRIERFNGESYRQTGIDGLEIKQDFVHTGNGAAPILEWRAANQGKVNLKLTYVKNVNGDQNPGYPDGVTIYIYKGDELLGTHQVDIKVDTETLLETNVDDLAVEEGDSLYIAVDPKDNNAYDGGLLYVSIRDVNNASADIKVDQSRKDNNANNVKDYGSQGENGWCYLYGKDVKHSKPVSTETEDGYINDTSPALVIKKDFLHPAANDNAILSWTPAVNGTVEVRGKYTKFEQNDGNPKWPDGVTVQIYLNQKKLFEKKVKAPDKGTNVVDIRETRLKVTPKDHLYFVVSANGNSSYDGGAFDVSIMDRNGMKDEKSITVEESETRQNVASVQDDFGSQGANGWFYQEGYQDEPFGAYNVEQYIEDDKYVDDSYLEIKRDYVNTGEAGRSAVIKWRVAQDGAVKIDASYTKTKNEDKNPDWPDGTRVTLYHNSKKLVQQEFAPEVSKEVTKSLNVQKVSVKKGDYITMVVNGKDNNAYDGGRYSFSITSVSGLVGATEKNVAIKNSNERTNNANVLTDFGEQGKNGWFYQYGYHTDPFFAVNIANYEKDDKYTTNDGVEIKRDYIMPSTKDKSANVKWKVAQDGQINIFADYTKLKNEDSNPDWPDGTVVTLMHNRTVLKSESFAADTKKEVKKDLSVKNLRVKKGDYITLLVNGKKNTAYDGGLYSFAIEDAHIVKLAKKNTSKENRANLAADFGEQGSNGWYYLEGRTLNLASALTKRTEDNSGYESVSDSNLQVKKDFVQPSLSKAAMYQWVVAQNGTVDVDGQYIKFGHEDANPDWPDGTRVRVYLNKTLLLEKNVSVPKGEDKQNAVKIVFDKQKVKKGDIFTFAVDARGNNAWDGGKLAMQIKPHESAIKFKPASENDANLFADFGEQGSNGWYYGYGNKSSEFKPADKNNEEYTSVLQDQLLLKKDGVHPGKDAGAIYRWIAGADGTVQLGGTYYKSRNEDEKNNTADGVKVSVYQNGKLLDGMSYNVKVSKTKEVVQQIEKANLKVSRGDKIDFIITAKKNTEWDYGKLEMNISTVRKPDYSAVADGRTNNTNLAESFGEQGNDGWFYLEGRNLESASILTKRTDDGEGYQSKKDDTLQVKKDYVQPGASSDAVYQWVAAQDGEVDIAGSYVKFGHNDANPAWPDGTKVTVYLNNTVLFDKKAAVSQGDGNDNTVKIELERQKVKKGDIFTFSINALENNAWDGGRLAIQIKPHEGEMEYKPAKKNSANLFADFGEQGSNGWYYGFGSDGNDFRAADMANGEYISAMHDGLLLKKDGVHPSSDAGAVYRWIAGEDGAIDLKGTYYKSRNENAEDNEPDGVEVKVYINGKLIEGMSYDIAVLKDKENVQQIEKSGLKVSKGDKIDFIIVAKGNAAWDYGKLEMEISDAGKAKSSRKSETLKGLKQAGKPEVSEKAKAADRGDSSKKSDDGKPDSVEALVSVGKQELEEAEPSEEPEL